jgi:hypothetical protein
VSCSGKSGEAAADDGNFTAILERSHFLQATFSLDQPVTPHSRRLRQIARRSATAQGTDGDGAKAPLTR